MQGILDDLAQNDLVRLIDEHPAVEYCSRTDRELVEVRTTATTDEFLQIAVSAAESLDQT